MCWRYQAALRDDVEVVVFRDADSHCSLREQGAVAEWLASDHEVHLIRDHPCHVSPIMGGLFGIRGVALRQLAQLLETGLFSGVAFNYGFEQIALAQRYYPLVRERALVHSNLLRFFPEYVLSLPPSVGNDFIGAYCDDRVPELAARRDSALPLTLLPPWFEERRGLRRLFRHVRRQAVAHGCRYCF